ncbi:MAG: methyltransferase domain-containing protein [Actinomycetota bacterium]|nr:methyltransferase domain-containing protein [Actinomycetota bacterium]
MRVLLVTHYFPPEIGAPQARLSELARHWAEAGDEVTVLTGMPNHPTGVVPEGYRRRLRMEERVSGYRVVRTWLYATPNEGVARKTLGHLSFMVSSVLLGSRRSGPADVVVASSPTFFSILSAWVLARRKGARFVVEVRDLWPAIIVQLGVLTNRWLVKGLELLELAAYRAADLVVVVSAGFRGDLVRRGVPADKVHTIRNGADLARFAPGPGGGNHDAARRRLGAAPDEVLVLYIGAHGISHGLESIAEAADKLTGQPIHVAFVGEGAAKHRLEERVAQLGLTNVTLLPGVAREDVPDLLAAADICLAPLRDVPLFATFIPSKIFEYLAAGKAVVGAVRGEPAEILRESGAVVVEPEDVAAIAEAILELAAEPARRAAMGVQGRRYVEEHFDRRRLAAQYRTLLVELTREPEGNSVGTAKAAVERFWDEEACGERYGRDQDRTRYVLEPEIMNFARFEEASGLDVLEIGVGMGADHVRWLRAGARAVGVDLTRRAVSITQSRMEAEGLDGDVRVADAEALPFDDGSFDIVYSWGVLHHTPDTERALGEAWRVLRPGGRLRVMLYHRRSWVALAAWARFGLLQGRPGMGLRGAVARVESPGTKAFTDHEARAMLAPFTHVTIRPHLTHWDRRVAPGLARALGHRFGWFLLVEAVK